MTLFGYPVEFQDRQLVHCLSVSQALAAYEAGYMPLVHPSIFDEVHQAIDELIASHALISTTPVSRAMHLLETSSDWPNGLNAIVMVDGSIAILDCRTRKQIRDNRFVYYRPMVIHQESE